MLNKLINRLKNLFPGRQLGAYALVGAWNTLLGYGLYAALVWGLDGKLKFAYMWANVLSNFIAITQAFFLYKFFVFKTKGHYWQEYIKCWMVYGAAALIGLAVLPLLVETLRALLPLAYKTYAPYAGGALLTALTVLCSFLGLKNFSFRTVENSLFARLKERWALQTQPQRRVMFLGLILAAGFLIALAVCALGLILHWQYYPYTTFLFDPRYRFTDLYETLILARGHTAGLNYFPLLMGFMRAVSQGPERILCAVFVSLWVAFYVSIVYKGLPQLPHKAGWTVLLAVGSFPLWLLADRANLEGFVFMACAGFVISFWRGRMNWAAFWLALAVNMKPHPAVFMVFFLRDKQYKALAKWLVLCVLIGALCSWAAHFDWLSFQRNVQTFSDWQQFLPFGLEFSHTFFNLLRLPVFLATQNGLPDSWQATVAFSRLVAPGYAVAMLGLFAFISAHVVFVRPAFWKALLLLTLAEVFFPFVSHDYTLIHLILPVLFFLNAPPMPPKQSVFITACLAVLLIPMNFWTHSFYHSLMYDLVLNAGSFLRPLAAGVLLAYLLKDFSFARLKTGIKNYFSAKK